jgi:hypothetical protein
MEEDEDFLYIAIEECAGNLEDLIKMAKADLGQTENSESSTEKNLSSNSNTVKYQIDPTVA